MALLQSGTRIYGNATIDTFLSISGNTAATNSNSGALTISGGMGVAGNVFSSANIYGNNITVSSLLTTTTANIIGDAVVGGNLTVNGNTVFVNVSTLSVEDPILELGNGPNNTPLTANDGKDRGQLLHYYSNNAIDAFMGWKTANSEFVFASDASSSVTNNITINQLANIRAGNADLGNLVTANYFTGTLTTNAQPNITSLGRLTSLAVTGTTSLGNVGKVKISGGSNGYILTTDGTGNLSWTNLTNIATAGNSTEVQYNSNGDLAASNTFVFNNITNTLTVTNIIANGVGLTNLTGANVTGQVSNALVSGTVYSNAQPNITSVGTLANLTVSGNSIFNVATANYFIGDGSNLTNLPSNVASITVSGTGNIANLTVASSANLGNVSNLYIGGGTSGKVLTTNGSGNLSWTNYQACVQSTVTNIVAGGEIQIAVDYSNVSYPAGVFTVNQLGPVVFTTTDSWSTGGTSKNAYANYVSNSINTQNVSITLSLANATFNVNASDSITIGTSTITGANLTGLNISGTGGTYTIPSSYLNNTTQTQGSDAVNISLTTSRGVKTSTGTGLTNIQPVPFVVNSLTGNFASSSVPYWDLNQAINWSASITGTVVSGNVTYSGGANGTLTTSGATSGSSSLVDSTLSYTITSTDYTGAGLSGAGTRTTPTTVTGSVTPATKYYPAFYKITSNNSNPNFSTSDSYYTSNYALGQGVNTSSTPTDYAWIAIPGNATHTFQFVFLASNIAITPDQTFSNQSIYGQTYSVYGFTNSSAPVFIYTLT